MLSNARAGPPPTAPQQGWFKSPARHHAAQAHGRDLPLHLIALILSYLDDVGDLARVTRTSRLFYYMGLPQLYREVTLRSYTEIRYIDGQPEGYGNGSPFAMGLNTLVSRPLAEYVQSFRVVGEWREHDVDDYNKGRVPDNSMMLQIAMRAALDRMKELKAFAWELSTKPMQTVYEGIMTKPSITSLTLRSQTRRIPRPTTLIPLIPNLRTLVVYDIDPLCYPDDISMLFLSKNLENLKLHWNPRMRESGEESVNLMNYFGRCIAAGHKLSVKRLAMYNLYARNLGDDFDHIADQSKMEELTMINCMGNSDPMTVFLDNTWKTKKAHDVPYNLKMLRMDVIEKEIATMMAQHYGMDRLYILDRRKTSKAGSLAATPITDAPPTPFQPTPSQPATPANGAPLGDQQSRSLAGEYLAVIQSNHCTMRHLLLSDHWVLSDDALLSLCQNCRNLEQLGFASAMPALDFLRRVFSFVPKLFALRLLVRTGSDLAHKIDSMESDMHEFALATELWKPDYKNLKYFGLGDKLIFKCGEVVYPKKGAETPVPPGQENSLNARRHGPIRRLTRVEWEDVKHVEIWGLDTQEFDSKFP
ncbi:hypothetical protein M011DRAFT_410582 [Sporormia fimetaria CBS 119925]|uniref:F-box domain-containing protein n=1 Tax=Sporormia fimetaria CBS 119925 TaxID=1340428 RepID=A0A6A6UYN5_9PLEO|nr:hypothetical protein M011DRAFT_410582 [Sporormia fimetaria CBS 119925]